MARPDDPGTTLLIPDQVRPLVDELLQAPLLPIGELRRQLSAHRRLILEATQSGEFVDLGLAEHVAEACVGLLDGLTEDTPEQQRRLVQLAVRYFVRADDAEGDLTSVSGFDDDAAVLNAVARQLGREELCIPTP